MSRVLWISLGAVLGANARYWLGVWVQDRWGAAFPWGTLLINVSGSFLLGLLMGALDGSTRPGAEALRLAAGVGFLGAYTTFSTFEVEALRLVQRGQAWAAAAYVAASVLAGLLAAWAGWALGSPNRS